MTDSTFTNNQALGAEAGNFGIGGAIENNAGPDGTHHSTATISDSVFTDNLAGGGVGVAGNGGALDNEGAGATMTLSNSTVRANRSVGGTGGGFGVGGGNYELRREYVHPARQRGDRQRRQRGFRVHPERRWHR